MASRVFRRLADAEARVHGTTPERVQFHDVGAIDAIVDVTGSCIGLHLLGIDAVHFGALPVGGGFIDGPHGRIPVPAPGHRGAAEGLPDPRHRDPPGAGDPDRGRHPDHAGRRRGRDAGDAGDRGGLRGGDHGARDPERAPGLRRGGGGGRAHRDPDRDHRPGRDDGRRHVAPALRATARAAARERRAGRLAHPGHHEAQPARGGPDRPLRAGPGRPTSPGCCFEESPDHRGAVDGLPARPARARDGPARHRARPGDLQGVPARRAGRSR